MGRSSSGPSSNSTRQMRPYTTAFLMLCCCLEVASNMRKVKLGEKELELRASPLALLFYRQAFGKDLIADLVSLQSLQGLAKGDFSGLDTVLLLQIAYAMHRAAKP